MRVRYYGTELGSRFHQRSGEQFDLRHTRHPPHVHEQHRRECHAVALPRHRLDHVPRAAGIRLSTTANVDGRRGDGRSPALRVRYEQHHRAGHRARPASVAAERRRVQFIDVGRNGHSRHPARKRSIDRSPLSPRHPAERNVQIRGDYRGVAGGWCGRGIVDILRHRGSHCR